MRVTLNGKNLAVRHPYLVASVQGTEEVPTLEIGSVERITFLSVLLETIEELED